MSVEHAPLGVDGDRLRAAIGHFATGVTVVTTLGTDGRPLGATANAVSSLSLRPPLLMVSLRNESATLAALRRAGSFAVNVLHAGQEPLAAGFARHDAEVWNGLAWSLGPAGSPVIDGVLATLECELHDLADGGDHRVVVGRVTAVEHPEDHVPPLIFYRGRYTRLVPPGDTTRLPARLAGLPVEPLEPAGAAVLVGQPRGSTGCLVYVHRGCTIGDGLRGVDCPRRRALDAALERMTADGRGVVLYHRDSGACCLGEPPARAALSDPAIAASLSRALDRLRLREPRLLVSREAIYATVVPPVADYVAL
jgi:3-hydroxy-9,10-secoandrosta-1,3,5(10)-triene-9,17-dione monooxygenase reductase component